MLRWILQVRWNFKVVQFGGGKPTTWKLGKLYRTQANGSAKILGGFITTKSDAERKAVAKRKADARAAEEKALTDFAKQQAAGERKASAETTRAARSDREASQQAQTWGNRPQGASRTARVCGKPTEDGTPCQRPIVSAAGCGADHSKAVRAMKARARTASQGVARKATSSTRKPAGKATKGRK